MKRAKYQITTCGLCVDERFAIKLADNGGTSDAYVALMVAPNAADVGDIAPALYLANNGDPVFVGFIDSTGVHLDDGLACEGRDCDEVFDEITRSMGNDGPDCGAAWVFDLWLTR